MTTELELIYSIHEVVRASEINADDPINERLMRSFLRIHRGKLLNRFTKKGNLVPDECFQQLPPIVFTNDANGKLVSTALPKVIEFSHHNGFIFQKDWYAIPLLDSEEFINSFKDKRNKNFPRLQKINNKLMLDLGNEIVCDQINYDPNSDLNLIVRKLKAEYESNNVVIDGRAVLVDTDQGVDYDWTKDNYPMPDDLIEDLINSVNAREFNLYLQVQGDNTGNMQHGKQEEQPQAEM